MIGTNGRWARTGRNACYAVAAMPLSRVHPSAGANLRREEPQERHRARRGKDHSPGQVANARPKGSGTPRQGTRRRMTRFGLQKRNGGARSGRIVPERQARLPRLGSHARSKTNEVRATGCLAAIVAKAADDGFGWNAPLACVRQVRASSPRFCERNTARTDAVERSASCAGATTQTSKRDRPEAGKGLAD